MQFKQEFFFAGLYKSESKFKRISFFQKRFYRKDLKYLKYKNTEHLVYLLLMRQKSNSFFQVFLFIYRFLLQNGYECSLFDFKLKQITS